MSREADLYKDKIEVSLDGRQIFYLFFGGAVIVGLVFVLGVMVGRRVEARGHVERARTTAVADPLAALDRLEGNNLSFKGSLMGKPTEGQQPVEKKIDELAQQRAKPEAVKKPEPPKPEVVAEKKPEPPKPEVVAEKKPEPQKVEAKKPEVVAEKKPEPQKVEAKKPEVVADKKPEAKPADVKPEDKKPEEKKSKYTLQLSSFQERAEADAFLASIKASGFDAHITEATVSGKAYYRVRMGTYRSIEAANDAKAEVEKTLKKSASVMKI